MNQFPTCLLAVSTRVAGHLPVKKKCHSSAESSASMSLYLAISPQFQPSELNFRQKKWKPTSKVVGQRFDVKFAEESWPPFQTRKAPEFMDPNMIVPDFAESAKYIEGSVQDHLHVYATGAVKDPMARLQFYVLFMQLPWLTMSGWGGR